MSLEKLKVGDQVLFLYVKKGIGRLSEVRHRIVDSYTEGDGKKYPYLFFIVEQTCFQIREGEDEAWDESGEIEIYTDTEQNRDICECKTMRHKLAKNLMGRNFSNEQLKRIFSIVEETSSNYIYK